VTETGGDERERLAAEIRNLNVSFETMALPALLNPLLSVELTIQQLKVLTMLVTTEDGMTGSGLSEAFGVSMASMSGLLDRLVAQGMAARSSDPHDARVRRVHATELGRSAMRRLVATRPEFGNDILMHLPLDDLRALAQGMTAAGAELRRLREQDAQASP